MISRLSVLLVTDSANIFIRGIAVTQAGKVIVLTTHRGLMRSTDGGTSWAKIESALPLHLEPSPLVQDGKDPSIVYAGFSLRPYSEPWRTAQDVAEQMRRDQARKRNTAIALALAALLSVGAAGFFLRKRTAAQASRSSGSPGEIKAVDRSETR